MNVLLYRATARQFLTAASKRSQSRAYAVQTPGAPTVEVFNNHTKWQQKERAAANADLSRKVDYLKDEVATRLCDRLLVRDPILEITG